MNNHVRSHRASWLAFVILGLSTTAGHARAISETHLADPSQSGDRAILKANNDTVSGTTIRNSRDGVVHPRTARPIPGIALIVETDPTGMCVGSNPPSSITVFSEVGPAWRAIASFPSSTFRIGALNRGRPNIIFGYPPFHHDYPVLRWDGNGYELKQSCPREINR